MSTFKFICQLEEIPRLGSRVVRPESGPAIALFRTAEDDIFALHDHCPHKGGPLSQGIVHGKKVACPLHNWQIELDTGHAAAPDEGHCSRFEVKVENGQVFLAA